jgi:hypothetical protein
VLLRVLKKPIATTTIAPVPTGHKSPGGLLRFIKRKTLAPSAQCKIGATLFRMAAQPLFTNLMALLP